MEFPDLGKHCSESSCKQLDFLPVKCDACHKIFCNDHFRYVQHNCPESYRKDNQVPVCPLCNIPIAVPKGQAPDLVVGQHIDNDCHQQKKKTTSNKCNVKGCKQKELIPVVCDKCRKNYCLRHRLAEDHECKGFEGSGHGVSNAGAAAASRSAQSSKSTGPFRNAGKPQQTTLTSVGRDLDRERRERQGGQRSQGQRSHGSAAQSLQAGMSEDEAMARALAMSMGETKISSQQAQSNPQSDEQKLQEEQDLALAQALQASEEEARRNRRAAALFTVYG